MTSIAPGQPTNGIVPAARARARATASGEVDRTRYPDSELMPRSIVECDSAMLLRPVLQRHQELRRIPSYVGSDNFIYYVKGDNKKRVAPDLYVYVGLEPTATPMQLEGHNNEQCWKTWLVGFAPQLSIEIKSIHDPRKDELESPERHDAMGTYELIVYDPFNDQRRNERRIFTVHRRNTAGKLVIVEETDADRVYSEVLDAYIISEGVGDQSRLRLATGPNGTTVLPFEGERADACARRAEEEARLRLDAVRRAEEEARLRLDAVQRAEEAMRRAAEMEAELARMRAAAAQSTPAKRLRAASSKRPSRTKKT